jgi:hypothetical protein
MSNRNRRVPHSRSRTLAAIAAAGCLAVAGASLGAGSAVAASLPTVNVAVTATSVSVSGALQSGAVNVVGTATGKLKEPSATLIALRPGVSVAEVEAFLNANKAGRDPNTVSKFGTLVFDNEIAKGKSEAQTVLAAGQYIAINPEARQSSKWPRTSFTVSASPAPAALPAPGAVERTIDLAFRGPKTLHDGELVRFENEGYLVHMDIAFPVRSHKAAKRAARDLLRGNERKAGKLIAGPPITLAGPLSTGGLQQETITAKPGWYVQACFMDTQDGRQHTQLGMERIIKIVK